MRLAAIPIIGLFVANSVSGADLPKVVRYPSRDGVEVDAGLYFPKHRPPPYRVAVFLHGGPHSRYANEDEGYVKPLLRAGYAVAAVDYRGSKGHGQDFEKAIVGDIGRKDVDDVLAIAPALKRNPLFDSGKLYVYGESYGGYLALMAATSPENVFAAAASLSGPADMLRQFELLRRCKDADCLEAFGEMTADAGGDELTRRAFLVDRSPSRRLERLRVPVLILHGRKDRYCPVEQAIAFFEKAKRLGKDVRVRVLEDVGHDLGSRDHRDAFASAMDDVVRFFDAH